MGRYASVNMSEFNQNRKKAVADMLTRGGKVQRDGIGVYMRWMAQMAPPSIGKQDIDPRFYSRPMMLLPKEINRPGNRHVQKDKEALKQGYSWKMYVRGKPRYFKSAKHGSKPPPEMQKMEHINFRGLLRWGFVQSLPDIGVAIPVAVRGLAKIKTGKGLRNNGVIVSDATIGSGEPQRIVVRVSNSAPGANQRVESLGRMRAIAKYNEYVNTMSQKLHSKQVKL